MKSFYWRLRLPGRYYVHLHGSVSRTVREDGHWFVEWGGLIGRSMKERSE